ncbi:MAG: N-acetylglucosamine-6-phosphate deacetylase [Clostridiales bacterium]|nr:N-acetylglucosamine-6-phosphate deacetylase [Clostridiales bacterium]
MIIQNALVFTLEQGFVKKDTVIEDGYFTGEKRAAQEGETVIDAAGNYLIPGLVDVHFHGCAGYDFSDGTIEALEAIGAYELRNGITSICPAAMTMPQDALISICENAYSYKRHWGESLASRLCGIHLEGPFLSAEKKGAQNPEFIQSPKTEVFDRLQGAAHGLVRLVTIAPEIQGAECFIRELGSKVHISVGHTTSDYETAYRAFVLGADHVTHLFNAMPGFTHRAPGVVGAAFDSKHVMPELVCDGIHVHSSAVRMAFEMFGKERMILISDSMRAAGMPDGDYSLGGLPVRVTGNLATLEDGTIAGSATNLMECMKTAVSMGIPLETAVRCATYNPAKSIGVDDVCGRIAEGMYGDCVILSKEDLSIEEVLLGGEVVRR